jgi:hypothetical protein
VWLSLPPCAALPGRRERLCLSFSPLLAFVFSLLPCCFCLVFLSFFVGCLFSVTVLPAVHPIILLAIQFSSATAQSGSSLVLRWVFLKTRSMLLRKTQAYTCHPIVITSPLASQHRHSIIHQHRTRQSVSSTRLSTDLTRRSVFTTPRAVDHSIVTTLRLLAIHLLLCWGLRFSAVFFGCRCCLVFVFVVILL